ncbi:hypothetical protein BDL97_01G197800 [Sphagnum fallax]|nr:hypothetical protein BDL97_01G197800 [Sphagnum fallax]
MQAIAMNLDASTAADKMEEDDGFQPLFDYSKVYDSPPKFQEDDSDEEEVIVTTQQRYGATKRCAGNMLTKIVQVTRIEKPVVKEVPKSEDSNDDDWLPSPPKLAKVVGLFSGDSMLQQLRQKRAELILLETEASGAVRCVEESGRLEAQIRHQQAPTAVKKTESLSHVEKVADPHVAVGKEKIVLRVQNKSGSIFPLRIYLADKFERLFTAYAKYVGASSPDQFMFQFDGDQLPPNSTPKELGMEDDDIIEVYDKSTETLKTNIKMRVDQ